VAVALDEPTLAEVYKSTPCPIITMELIAKDRMHDRIKVARWRKEVRKEERRTIHDAGFWTDHFYFIDEEDAERLVEIAEMDPIKAFGLLEIFLEFPRDAEFKEMRKWAVCLMMMDECDLEFFEFGDYERQAWLEEYEKENNKKV
jgi:hypothetical protein